MPNRPVSYLCDNLDEYDVQEAQQSRQIPSMQCNRTWRLCEYTVLGLRCVEVERASAKGDNIPASTVDYLYVILHKGMKKDKSEQGNVVSLAY
jgi:hypothetical protein